MSIDIYHTRRTNFKKCYYYVRDKSIADLSKYVLEKKPAGFFYAKPFTPNSRQNQDLANVFRMSEHQFTIMTEDDVDSLEENNIVLYDGKPYVAIHVQRKEHIKEGQFGHGHYTTYIALRR